MSIPGTPALTIYDLDAARRDLLRRSGGGISMPVAGAIYWAALGTAGYFLTPSQWVLAAFFGSGTIFPLALLLAKPLRSDLMIRNHPLNSLAPRAVLAINLLWPVYFAMFATAPALVPLSLAIGMGLHWPIIGWLYNSRACMEHAVARVTVVSLLWFGYPQGRYTVLPFAVAAIYLVTIHFMRREVAAANHAVAQPI